VGKNNNKLTQKRGGKEETTLCSKLTHNIIYMSTNKSKLTQKNFEELLEDAISACKLKDNISTSRS